MYVSVCDECMHLSSANAYKMASDHLGSEEFMRHPMRIVCLTAGLHRSSMHHLSIREFRVLRIPDLLVIEHSMTSYILNLRYLISHCCYTYYSNFFPLVGEY